MAFPRKRFSRVQEPRCSPGNRKSGASASLDLNELRSMRVITSSGRIRIERFESNRGRLIPPLISKQGIIKEFKCSLLIYPADITEMFRGKRGRKSMIRVPISPYLIARNSFIGSFLKKKIGEGGRLILRAMQRDDWPIDIYLLLSFAKTNDFSLPSIFHRSSRQNLSSPPPPSSFRARKGEREARILERDEYYSRPGMNLARGFSGDG